MYLLHSLSLQNLQNLYVDFLILGIENRGSNKSHIK